MTLEYVAATSQPVRQKKTCPKSSTFSQWPYFLMHTDRHTTFKPKLPLLKSVFLYSPLLLSLSESCQNKLLLPLNYSFIADVPNAFLISRNLGFSYSVVPRHTWHLAIIAINTSYSNGLLVCEIVISEKFSIASICKSSWHMKGEIFVS